MWNRRYKYKNKTCEVDGIKFHSKKEAARYEMLKLMVRCKAIKNLETQVAYLIKVNGVKICKYIADFRYYSNEQGMEIVEDVKGYKTKEYILKKKLMLAVFGIDIFET